jgi:mannose-6-phosphate isomerase-like protein (cupin superfamily)
MAETLKLTPSESVTIRSSAPDALEVEVEYGPGGSPPPKHWHPAQDEHFRVLEGSLRVRVDDSERELAPGDEIEIPRTAVHQMWNPGAEPARARWVTRPAGRTERWFRELGDLQASGRVDSNGMPSPLAFGVLLTEYRDVFRLAGPEPLLRGAFWLLGVVGRARGYRAGAAGARSG